MALEPSSPRLPSPPPQAEIQIGPQSPGLVGSTSSQTQQMEQTVAEANAKRRIRPGTKVEDMAAGPPLIPLHELDSAFQLQEHLAALHHHFTHSSGATQPITRKSAAHLAQPPPNVDRTLWLYELCRFLISQCNSLIVGFLFDTPPCSSATCPEMRASEWQFLCAVHDTPKSCCAIDYCCHTLDWAANIVTNPKIFPSRLVMNEGQDKNAVLKNLVNIFRRLHRIFAHAWFQHRGVFWAVEAQTGLYVFFKTVCDIYDLLPAENYKLPPEAEGLEPAASEKEDSGPKVTAIAVPPAREVEPSSQEEENPSALSARRTNTARHSSRPSTGSAVTTVIEEREDESSETAGKLKQAHISAPETVNEENEVEVPVIVESGLVTSNGSQAGYAESHPSKGGETSEEITGSQETDSNSHHATKEESKDKQRDFLDGDSVPAFEHEKVEDPIVTDTEVEKKGIEDKAKEENLASSKPATEEAKEEPAVAVADFAADGASDAAQTEKDDDDKDTPATSHQAGTDEESKETTASSASDES